MYVCVLYVRTRACIDACELNVGLCMYRWMYACGHACVRARVHVFLYVAQAHTQKRTHKNARSHAGAGERYVTAQGAGSRLFASAAGVDAFSGALSSPPLVSITPSSLALSSGCLLRSLCPSLSGCALL